MQTQNQETKNNWKETEIDHKCELGWTLWLMIMQKNLFASFHSQVYGYAYVKERCIQYRIPSRKKLQLTLQWVIIVSKFVKLLRA
jgi:hypothetical protein